MAGYWTEQAELSIYAAIQKAKAEGLDIEATKKAVNAAYPFGVRQYFPYKKWLEARKKAFALLDGLAPIPKPRKQHEKQEPELPEGMEQIGLFDKEVASG